MPLRPIYLHGFASGPSSTKAAFLARRFRDLGVPLAVPRLDEGEFERLTVTRQLRVVSSEIDAGTGGVALIGSSMGGYLAALAAARDPRVERIVLLAPGFDPKSRWDENFPGGGIVEWRRLRRVEISHFVYPGKRAIDFGLYEDFANHDPFPRVACPALVLAGSRDEVVPVAVVRRWCAENPTSRLVVLDTDHAMGDVLEQIWSELRAFLLA